jgi:hypothetical protein
MKKFGINTIGLAAIALVSGLCINGSAQTPKKPVIRKSTTVTRPASTTTLFRVNAGKKIRVRMNDTISSKTSRVGDNFTVTVTEPVYSTTGAVVIPTGSELTGRVTAVRRAVKGGRPGEIDATFVRVTLPNGYRRAINGSLTELSSESAKSDNEGTARGDTMKHRKVVFIGGGGVGGAVLGGALGGPKGALIGGIIGAGAGLLGEKFTKGEEAEVRSGTEFGVYLNQAVSLPRYREVE